MASPRNATTKTARPARKRAAAPPRAAAKPTTTLVELFTESDDTVIQMTPLFSIDGVEHCIPAEPNAGMALRFIEQMRQGTDEYTAMAELLEELLGAESYQALMDFKGRMTPQQLLQLMGAAQAAVMGLVEVPKGS